MVFLWQILVMLKQTHVLPSYLNFKVAQTGGSALNTFHLIHEGIAFLFKLVLPTSVAIDLL